MPADAEWRPRHNPWAVALTVTMATFMEVLDTSIANVALPHIAGGLSATPDESTWILTSYLVSNAIVLPLSAWFSEVFGRKRFYMTCVALFTISSFLCGLAPSLSALVICRVLQGAGGGGLQPSEQAILADTFRPEQRGMAFAVYGIAVVSAPALGPTLGGWITDNISWRWIFYINIPVGIASLLLTHIIVEDPPGERGKGLAAGGGIDAIGIGLIAIGLGCLQVVLDKGQEDDWFASSFITAFSILAGLGLVGAILWELKQEDPIIDLRLLAERNFGTAFALMFLLGVVLLGSTVLVPLFLQTLMGYTAMESGLALTWGALGIMALMPFVGWALGKIEARWLIAVGLLISASGLFRMAHWDLEISFWRVALDRVIQAAGLAFLFVPINTVAYMFIPRGKNNTASALINVARNVGGSVGISMMTTLTARRAQVHQNILIAHLTPYDVPYQQSLQAFSHTMSAFGSGTATATGRALSLIYDAVQRQASMLAIVDVFWLMAAIVVAILPIVFLLRHYDPAHAHVAAH